MGPRERKCVQEMDGGVGGVLTPCSLVGGWCPHNQRSVRNRSVSNFCPDTGYIEPDVFMVLLSPYRQMPVWYRCPFYRVPEKNGIFHGMSGRMQALCDMKLCCSGTPSSCNCCPIFSIQAHHKRDTQ